jgi:hypothetical protein
MKDYGLREILTEAAKERREELILTSHDVAFLKACGVEAPVKEWNANEELQRFQDFFRTYEPEKTLGRQILERFWEEDR